MAAPCAVLPLADAARSHSGANAAPWAANGSVIHVEPRHCVRHGRHLAQRVHGARPAAFAPSPPQDFQGQWRAERTYQILIISFSVRTRVPAVLMRAQVIGWIIGYITQSFAVTFAFFSVGVCFAIFVRFLSPPPPQPPASHHSVDRARMVHIQGTPGEVAAQDDLTSLLPPEPPHPSLTERASPVASFML